MGAEPLFGLREAFAGRLLVDPSDTAPFLRDWRGRWIGRALAVVQPDTATDVAAVVRWCAARGVPIVPQGGNTGLSGGSVPDESGRALVLSLARLSRIRAVDPGNSTLTAEAGVTLEQAQQAAAAAGRLFPLSLAAQGTCTIGGNLSTNAGGVQVLRYGNARELCLGLEVVTPQGEIWDGLRGLRKDNTGYDLRDLYIGAEGTLGVITAAVLRLYPQPAARVVALAAVPTPHAAMALFEIAVRRAGARLTAFELFSDLCLALVLRHIPGTRAPFAQAHPWHVLIELSDEEGEAHAQATLERLLEEAMELSIVADAAVGASIEQCRALWALREHISEAQAAEGRNVKHDIAVPISRIADFVAATGAELAERFPGLRPVVFGHLGDGNLHYNVSPPAGQSTREYAPDFAAIEARLNRLVHDAVAHHGGSISAEHGLGVLRRDEAARYKSEVELGLLRAIKAALDPQGIMNPGKSLG
ncbi:MAG: FAD-binding oxidoreductase [Gammaproteobacteria bacterium]